MATCPAVASRSGRTPALGMPRAGSSHQHLFCIHPVLQSTRPSSPGPAFFTPVCAESRDGQDHRLHNAARTRLGVSCLRPLLASTPLSERCRLGPPARSICVGGKGPSLG